MRIRNWPMSVLMLLCVSLLCGCNYSGNKGTSGTDDKNLSISDIQVNGGPVNHSTSLSRVPMPSEQVAQVEVENYVSTLKNMDIAYVGKQIPYTFSHGKITNSRGYNWWVSKHFALKTDLPEDKATLYLELLEMSYPHYVTLFGMEPPNIKRQRIAVVYGASRESTRESMLDDGFRRGVHTHAGGETMYYNRAGYSFPSHRQQHQRYIVIHETMHAFHMALNGHSTWAPNWITEGMADAIAHHVYDPAKHQLTVMVFDRAPMNYVQTGLKQYAQGGHPSISQINDDPALKRGLNFFIVHFLLSDPQRAQYFALFRDRLMAANPHSDDTLPTANALLKETFPDWPQLEKEFADFVQQARSSFHIASGPWEQAGNQYFIRSSKQKYMPRLDILLPQNYPLRPHPVMDFPAPEKTHLIQLVEDSPFTAGLLVEFVKEQMFRGKVGIGLGLTLTESNRQLRKTFVEEADPSQDSFLQVMIEQGKYLVISGHNLDTYRLGIALKDEIRQALLNTYKLGVSIHVLEQRLRITLSAGQSQQLVSYALTPELQEHLTHGDISLLAESVGHGLTPYLPFDGQRLSANLPTPWLAKEWQDVESTFRTCELGSEAFVDCNKAMDNLFMHIKTKGKDADFYSLIQQLQASFIQGLKSTRQDKLASILAGVEFTVEHHQQQPFVRVVNASRYPLSAEFVADKNWALQQNTVGSLVFEAGSDNYIALQALGDVKNIEVAANMQWQGMAFNMRDTDTVQSFDGVNLHADYRLEQEALSVIAQLTGPYSGQSSGTVRFEVFPSHAVLESVQEVAVEFAPYEVITQAAHFSLKPQATNLTVRVVADLVVDGEDIQLNHEMYLQ